MKLRTVLQIAVVALMLGLLVGTASAQRTARFTLDVSDHSSPVVTLYFGNDDSASYAIDDGTAGTIDIGETEGPPAPPSGEDVRWKPPHNPQNAWGTGLVPKDYRAFPTNATKKDTFKVTFSNTDIPDSAWTFTWGGLVGHCDSAFFVWQNPNDASKTTVDMLANGSTTIAGGTDLGGSPAIQANIFVYGAQRFTGVEPTKDSPAAPKSFGLSENFPNPFNPSTTLKFDIQKNANTEVAIFNIVGQRIATLVTAQLSPGTYSAVWNGTTDNGAPVASGIYFARLSARVEGAAEPFVATRKLLLMK